MTSFVLPIEEPWAKDRDGRRRDSAIKDFFINPVSADYLSNLSNFIGPSKV
jgi:hypothetical protein